MISQALKISSGELLKTIHWTAESFGAKGVWGTDVSETGVCRLALSDLDKKVRDWFVGETKSLGCTVKVDEVGNIFATYPGKNNDQPATGVGSHLDTQPTGGRYDGIYGVLSGLQVLRTLKQNNYVPNFPITLVDWCNEEGARFPVSMMASSVWSGQITKEYVYGLKDVFDGKTTVEDELKRIGYLGDVKCSHKANPLNCHFEIHIEQGPILESLEKKIGVVTGAQAFAWLNVTFEGMAQHTGTTPLEFRRDALLAASKVIVGVNDIAKELGGLGTVGKLNLEPAVVNVIPEKVSFVVDIRHHTDAGFAKIEQRVREYVASVSENKAGNGVALSYKIDNLYRSPAVNFNSNMIEIIRESAASVVGTEKTLDIVSGAGHDSCTTNPIIPTAMIFVPSKDGISHNPKEFTHPEEVELGFRVLLEAILQYDQQRLTSK